MTQITILLICLAHLYFMRSNLPTTLMLLAVMETGAMMGMRMGNRIRSKAEGLSV